MRDTRVFNLRAGGAAAATRQACALKAGAAFGGSANCAPSGSAPVSCAVRGLLGAQVLEDMPSRAETGFVIFKYIQ